MQYIVCFSKKYRIQVPFFTPKENTARYCGVFLFFFVKSTVYSYFPKTGTLQAQNSERPRLRVQFRNKEKFCASILTNFIYSV